MTSQSGVGRTPAGASHQDRVYAIAENHDAAEGIEDISTSWRRCLSQHGIAPGGKDAPRILTARELSEVRDPVEELISAAQEENDRLHTIIGKAGYAVLLTSPEGVVVDFRGDAARADQFRRAGIWMGGIWSESVEGTNGIGTCIAEERPVTVHRSQHFRTRHTALSCCGAPVFGPTGEVAAVLDVTSLDPDVSDRSHALALVVTIDSARAIEETLFRRSFGRAWTLAIAVPGAVGPPLMLAVDDDHRIAGADRTARSTLGIDDASLAGGLSLWAFFERSPWLLRTRADDATVFLKRIGDTMAWGALITPPETSLAHTRASAQSNASHHRLDRAKVVGPAPETTATLSPRELHILGLIGQGQSNKEMARFLHISPETVKSHVKNLFLKLGVERRAQAIARAQSLGLFIAP